MTIRKHIGKILVVDDSKAVRDLLAGLLRDAGHDISLAEDGRQGWQIIQHKQIDLIISDLEMPVLDGFGLCRLVKENPDYKNIYFILLSTKDSTASKVKGLEIGADDYMGKGIAESEFLARIKAGLRIRALEKELEEKRVTLFQHEKMASIAQLAAGVAHEINNPIAFIASNLRSLNGYCEKLTECIFTLLKEIKPESLDDIEEIRKRLKINFIIQDSAELIEESLDGAERICHIVQTLKDSSRVDQDACVPTDINVCLDQVLGQIWEEIKDKVTINKDYSPLPLAMCQPLPLQQTLSHLLTNAYQALEGNGIITLNTWAENGGVSLSITDNGIGIPAKDIDRIFEPFYTTHEVGAGMGLGLSLAYDTIVNKHHGTISVQSRPGQETIFTLHIPIQA